MRFITHPFVIVLLLVPVWLGGMPASALMASEVTASPDSTASGVPDDYPVLGTVTLRHARDITASNWSIGAETMCRDYTVYKHWREHLGPLGVKHARIQSGWAKTEQTKGVYDWAWLDEIIPDMVEQGVTPWVCLCYGNPIYADGGNATAHSPLPASDEALQGWDAFVRAFVERYQAHIDEYEIWNEPQHKGITIPDYTAFYIRTAEVIRSIQPEAKLFCGSTAGIGRNELPGILQGLKDAGKLDLVTAATYHPYHPNPSDCYRNVLKLQATIQKEFAAHITMFQGENGAPSAKSTYGALSNGHWDEVVQAKWMMRRMLGDLGHGIRSSYFGIADMHYLSKGKKKMNTKGLIETNPDKTVKRVKLSYRCLQRITALFDAELGPVVHAPKLSGHKVFVFHKETDNGETQAVSMLWRTGRPAPGTDAKPITVRVPATGMEALVLVDLFTGTVHGLPESQIKREGDAIEISGLPVGDWPLIVANRNAFGWTAIGE